LKESLLLVPFAGYGPENFKLSDEDSQSICEVFSAWPQLQRLNINDQPLDVPGSFPALLTPITSHLTKLSLVRALVVGLQRVLFAR